MNTNPLMLAESMETEMSFRQTVKRDRAKNITAELGGGQAHRTNLGKEMSQYWVNASIRQRNEMHRDTTQKRLIG